MMTNGWLVTDSLGCLALLFLVTVLQCDNECVQPARLHCPKCGINLCVACDAQLHVGKLSTLHIRQPLSGIRSLVNLVSMSRISLDCALLCVAGSGAPSSLTATGTPDGSSPSFLLNCGVCRAVATKHCTDCQLHHYCDACDEGQHLEPSIANHARTEIGILCHFLMVWFRPC